LAGNLALFHKLEKTELPLGLLILRVQHGVLSSFHSLAPPPTYKYWRRDCVFYFSLPLPPSLLAFPLAKVLSEHVFLRTIPVLNFKGGDLRTFCIFGDGSEEGSIKRVDDNCARLVEDDSVPPRRPGSSGLRLCGRCDTSAQGLIGLIGYSYQQVAIFSEADLQKTLRLSMLGLEESGDG